MTLSGGPTFTQGGTLTMRTLGEEDEENEAVVVEVSDTGQGIPEEIRERIFDPFFTTKDVGEGTGLGLSICHNIVTAHGGRIEVDSRPGAGTCFRVALPLHSARDAS